MQAVVMREFGDAGVLELDEVPDPVPTAGEALIRVGAVEVSRTRDVATRTGHHPFSRQVSLPHVLGGDFAGVVEAAGPGVDPELVGRRVAVSNSIGCGTCLACLAGHLAQCPRLSMLGIHRWGSYAELAAAPAQNLSLIPDEVSLADAAAMAATGPIALTQLLAAEVGAGTRVLITGATGALGTMLIVLAAARGARVLALSRRPDRIPAGVEPAVRFRVGEPGLADAIGRATAGSGVEAVIDNVAHGETFASYISALTIGGRIVISGAIGGPDLTTLPVPAQAFYVRSLSLLGVRTASRRDTERFWALVQDGLRLPAHLVRELPLSAAADAHADVARGVTAGHTVLSVTP
jgi:NADPH:quinone reductase-like Zn-dependent oxidoreductase